MWNQWIVFDYWIITLMKSNEYAICEKRRKWFRSLWIGSCFYQSLHIPITVINSPESQAPHSSLLSLSWHSFQMCPDMLLMMSHLRTHNHECDTIINGSVFLNDCHHDHLRLVPTPPPISPLQPPCLIVVIAISFRESVINTLWMDTLVTDAGPKLALFWCESASLENVPLGGEARINCTRNEMRLW